MTVLSPSGILADPHITSYWRFNNPSGDTPDETANAITAAIAGLGVPVTYSVPGDDGDPGIQVHEVASPPRHNGAVLFGESVPQHFGIANPGSFWNAVFANNVSFTILARVKLDAAADGGWMPIWFFDSTSGYDALGLVPDTGQIAIIHAAKEQVASEDSLAETLSVDGHFSNSGIVPVDTELWVAWAYEAGVGSTLWVDNVADSFFSYSRSHTVNPAGTMHAARSLYDSNTIAHFFGGSTDRVFDGVLYDLAIFASDLTFEAATSLYVHGRVRAERS